MVDPAQALIGATAKFERRFAALLEKARRRGMEPSESSLEELDALWDEVKLGEGVERDDGS